MRIPLISAVLLLVCSASVLASSPRTFEFSYVIAADQLPDDEDIDIYIPLPAHDGRQEVLSESIQSSLPAEIRTEPVYGNRYIHLKRTADSDTELQVTLQWKVSRQRVESGDRDGLNALERERYLAPNALVPVGHDILEPILEDIHASRADDSKDATARAIYDWVVDNVEYKKVGSGWGNGDTFWACNERYGNCTDFHALFISLARTEGIPARFEIGFPVPEDRQAGEIGGYHCWVEFYLPGQGWVPIDASEAAKHPDRRELLYGTHPADRIHFTTGRDLVLSPASEHQPLNYLIYPYVEVGGEPWNGKLEKRFSYRDL